MPTAIAPTTVSRPSCSFWGSSWSMSCRRTPIARQMAAADTTPTQTQRRASVRPSWRRNVAMMETMSAASTPSRRPITNVGSMRAS
jgi:hypothetical protein